MLSLPNRSTVDYWLNSATRAVDEILGDKAVVGGLGLAAARK